MLIKVLSGSQVKIQIIYKIRIWEKEIATHYKQLWKLSTDINVLSCIFFPLWDTESLQMALLLCKRESLHPKLCLGEHLSCDTYVRFEFLVISVVSLAMTLL